MLLVLGSSGMLGHKLCQVASQSIETIGIGRERVDARDIRTAERALADTRPDVVVNCIGIVKQSPLAQDPLESITVNALFPHQLATICRDVGARLIHLSTDCVFSGRKGMYSEADRPDPVDSYGMTKLLGEVDEPGCLTIRTSMIGRELGSARGLLEWFLGQRGQTVHGYRQAIFSGFTTTALSKIIVETIIPHPELQGIWHVASSPISKHELLTKLNEAYSVGAEIVPDDEVVCDRSLDGSKFNAATGFVPPSWDEMIAEMVGEKNA
ncbi:MAG: SDR family oxidoreductase [Candidatus Bipolaricaulis sp.]|nr:SDR family oxidoreductase [Candidatus Bipolaricaulis sp.]